MAGGPTAGYDETIDDDAAGDLHPELIEGIK